MIAAAASTALVTGCSDDGRDTPAPAPTTSEPSSTEPTDDWRDNFTDEQLQAYDGALAAFETYETQSLPYWEAGVATPEAEAFFARWWFAPTLPMNLLETYESAAVVVDGNVTVLESRPQTIAESGADVEIVQCVDPTSRTVVQRGVQASGAAQEPLERIVSMSMDGDGEWRLTSLPTAEAPCS